MTPLQYSVTQEADTERQFTGIHWNRHGDGIYRGVAYHEAALRFGHKVRIGHGLAELLGRRRRRRAAAEQIIDVIPYFGYGRSDRRRV